MPQSFKALASITVWVLFVLGWVGVVAAIGGIVGITTGLFSVPSCTLLMMGVAFGGGVVCFILSACAMKLRQMLE